MLAGLMSRSVRKRHIVCARINTNENENEMNVDVNVNVNVNQTFRALTNDIGRVYILHAQ